MFHFSKSNSNQWCYCFADEKNQSLKNLPNILRLVEGLDKILEKIHLTPYNKKIVLENGYEFFGYGFGADREAINEIVFNTSMVGYQEIISDPSYTGQMVVMTYPLIGNYGITDED